MTCFSYAFNNKRSQIWWRPCGARARVWQFTLPLGLALDLYRFCKQKYQKGFIHRKLKVATSVISSRPKIQYRIGLDGRNFQIGSTRLRSNFHEIQLVKSLGLNCRNFIIKKLDQHLIFSAACTELRDASFQLIRTRLLKKIEKIHSQMRSGSSPKVETKYYFSGCDTP